MPAPADATDQRWTAALEAVGAVRGDSAAVFAGLQAGHAIPVRHHHTFEHASEVVDGVLVLHAEGDPWPTAVLAAWFHDVVYEPLAGRGANEGASAVEAVRVLSAMGATHAAVGEVARLICLTADHDPRAHDRGGCLLTDADLSILGADADRYDRYAAAVRAEYAHVTDESWVVGRSAVLRSFLDRPKIYRTAAGRARWEAQARTNISRELGGLHA